MTYIMMISSFKYLKKKKKNSPTPYVHIQYFSQNHELEPSPSILEVNEVVSDVPTWVGSNYLHISLG
jgi:hypothetical protein